MSNIPSKQLKSKSGLSNSLQLSLLAFNGSTNCDHTTHETFYNSYIDRKKETIRKRMYAAKNGDTNVNKDKLMADVRYLVEAKEKKNAVLGFLTDLKETKLDASTLESVERLLSDINLG